MVISQSYMNIIPESIHRVPQSIFYHWCLFQLPSHERQGTIWQSHQLITGLFLNQWSQNNKHQWLYEMQLCVIVCCVASNALVTFQSVLSVYGASIAHLSLHIPGRGTSHLWLSLKFLFFSFKRAFKVFPDPRVKGKREAQLCRCMCDCKALQELFWFWDVNISDLIWFISASHPYSWDRFNTMAIWYVCMDGCMDGWIDR